jgi:hypothetical protein
MKPAIYTLSFLVLTLGITVVILTSNTNRGNVSERPAAASNSDDPQLVLASDKQAPETPRVGAQPTGTGVIINGREITPIQARQFAVIYHNPPVPGRYWYDSRSGAWGYEGRQTGGFLYPGHDYGPLAANASNGDTGIFINGREITSMEAMALKKLFGVVYQGHFWIDGGNGNVGVEGNPMPVANIAVAMRNQQQQPNFNCGATYCAGFNSQGEGYVDVNGGTIVSIGH